jgi:hypothetical protein
MAYAKTVPVESIDVEGNDVVVSFRLPADDSIVYTLAKAHEGGTENVLLVISEEGLFVNDADIDWPMLRSRASQTSWAQALKERLTGTGPKQAKE